MEKTQPAYKVSIEFFKSLNYPGVEISKVYDYRISDDMTFYKFLSNDNTYYYRPDQIFSISIEKE